MKRLAAFVLLAAIAAFWPGQRLCAQGADNLAPRRAGIAEGLWEGSITLKKAGTAGGTGNQGSLSSGLILKILPVGSGALLDIPEQSMFGYPLDEVVWDASRIRFILDALGPGEDLVCEGVFSGSATKGGEGGVIVGMAKANSWKGTFMLRPKIVAPVPNEKALSIKIGDVALPGTLLFPSAGQANAPLVLLLAGAGNSDRNGNNYSVPGKSDSLSLLATALSAKGVASYRYDKRGSGEAYLLEHDGLTTSLAIHSSDAAAVMRYLRAMDGFSRVIVAGMNEGAWAGAAAMNRLEAEGIFVDGFVVLDSSGVAPREELEASLRDLDEGTRAEARAIIEAIMAGESFPAPSAALSDFFSASRIEWLKSWLSFDPAAEIAKVQAPVLFVHGASDLQVSGEAFERLLRARPKAAARQIPAMNYLLKQVKTEEENYDSFTNPGYSLAEGLVDLLAAFAKAKPVPAGSVTIPYERPGAN